MPAPKGNQFAKGHDGTGTGRGFAIEEARDFKLLLDMFTGVKDRDEILKEIESGKFSVMTALVAKALSGNTTAQVAIFQKLFPDSLVIKGFEKSMYGEEIQMSDEKYRDLIRCEYDRLGLGKKADSKK